MKRHLAHAFISCSDGFNFGSFLVGALFVQFAAHLSWSLFFLLIVARLFALFLAEYWRDVFKE